MRHRKPIVVVLALVALAAALGLAGCSAKGGVVDAEELRDLQADGARVIDVRSPAEYASGRIPGAENVPVETIGSAAATWDRNAPVVLYCQTGSRSAEAAITLRDMGFAEVYDFSGGTAVWDGEVERPAVAAKPLVLATSGIPVLYEFYTDT